MQLKEPHQYAPLLTRIARAIWKREESFPFVPCTFYLGHLFWEITMAVAVARKNDRKLILLKPGAMDKVLNPWVFDCDFACRTERKPWHDLLLAVLGRYERARMWPLRLLHRFLRLFRAAKTLKSAPRFHRCGVEASAFVMAKVAGTKAYFDLALLPQQTPSITLTQSQKTEAAQRLANSGFDSQRWFVAAHVREASFRGNEDYHDFRNFSQHSLLPIVRVVVSQGGQVVRLGTQEQSRIPDTKGIFDYARSTARSGLVDMYLMENSKYYVGSSSGPLSMAYAFGKPAFIVNYVDFLVAGFRKTDMYIPKRIYSPQEHRPVSICEFCGNVEGIWEPDSFWFVENSFEEIAQAFSDFQKYADSGFELAPEDREIYQEWADLRKKTLLRIIAEPDRDGLRTSFKDVAASTLEAPAVMAPSYLRKHLFDAC